MEGAILCCHCPAIGARQLSTTPSHVSGVRAKWGKQYWAPPAFLLGVLARAGSAFYSICMYPGARREVNGALGLGPREPGHGVTAVGG